MVCMIVGVLGTIAAFILWGFYEPVLWSKALVLWVLYGSIGFLLGAILGLIIVGFRALIQLGS
jgi:hypothetical protein